ncbi:MAG: hypothetical protein K0U45_04630, partial [Alphaproteobacteria bacterium]|nr:hypothetical protein [Alphaproteobacteria bacterium]
MTGELADFFTPYINRYHHAQQNPLATPFEVFTQYQQSQKLQPDEAQTHTMNALNDIYHDIINQPKK